VWAPLDGTIGGGAKRVKQSAGHYALRGFCYTRDPGAVGGRSAGAGASLRAGVVYDCAEFYTKCLF